MIALLSGTIKKKDGNSVILLTKSGVGYEVHIDDRSLENIVVNSVVELYIYHYIRENREDLFGFTNESDIYLFRMLIGISGIGPSAARDILSSYGYDKFVEILSANDIQALCDIKGIGRKTAQRILVDLNERLEIEDILNNEDEGKLRNITSELRQLLRALSFSSSEIKSMIDDIPRNELIEKDIDELAKLCLRKK